MIGTESHPVLFPSAPLIHSEVWLCAEDHCESRSWHQLEFQKELSLGGGDITFFLSIETASNNTDKAGMDAKEIIVT